MYFIAHSIEQQMIKKARKPLKRFLDTSIKKLNEHFKDYGIHIYDIKTFNNTHQCTVSFYIHNPDDTISVMETSSVTAPTVKFEVLIGAIEQALKHIKHG